MIARQHPMAYCIPLNSISNALNDILDHRPIITMGFIVPKAHLTPLRCNRVPVNLDDSIINLLA
jgi:hypothetical protein